MNESNCDALVFFGATGDLAYKKIFPALQAMVKRGTLDLPVIGVAKSGWGLEQLQARMRESLQQHGALDPEASAKLGKLLRYVDGDYADAATFKALKLALGSAQRPAFYLAIPPVLFGKVVEQLASAGCATSGARVIVEKPFGRDLESARNLNRILLKTFEEAAIFRIDHYLGKRPVHNLLFFRVTNPIYESIWHRQYVDSIQMTMAESFGVEDRGAFYDQTGAIRDVIQNHMFQVLSTFVMEPPARNDSESVRDEKVKVLKAIAPLGPADVIRGQFVGYRSDQGVAAHSQVETFAAVRLAINNWRWQGVPVFIRAGKKLSTTRTEIVARLRRPPPLLAIEPPSNYVRFRISPHVEMAFGVTVMDEKETGVGETIELLASRDPGANEPDAYERLLADALMGDRTLFAREDYVEEAWRIVDPILKQDTPLYPYEPGSWGPKEVAALTPPGGWRDLAALTPAAGWEDPVAAKGQKA
jgi:glucose-6-phosphate 1-dehydrogenase